MVGFIKLHRKIMSWDWYKDSNMVHLFLHLIMNASLEDDTWQGIAIKRGQVVIGRKSLTEATGISERSIRTCLDRLKTTSEVTIKSTNRYSILTICNYDDYQPDKNTSDQPNASQTPANRPHIKKIRSKEVKENLLKESSEVEPRSVRIQKTIEQYKVWGRASKWDLYREFLTWLLKEDLKACFALTDQFSEEKFRAMMKRHNPKMILVHNKISAMENQKGLEKNNKSFSRTLNNWLSRDTNR